MLRHALLLVLILVAVQAGWSAPVVMEVQATANIFRAGTSDTTTYTEPTGIGSYPTQYAGALPSGPNPYLILYFPNMTGQVSYNGQSGYWNDPDGLDTGPSGANTGTDTLVATANGISGIGKHDRIMFLVGVFLGDGVPNNNMGPDSNNYDDADTQTEFRPVIGQTFFIGDGRTSTGQLQHFYVPQGATRLYLGFADGDTFQGSPSYYGDNAGSFTVTAEFGSAVPEPGTMILVSMALLGGLWRFRKRG